MHVKELHIRRFRGFSDLTVRPKGHVVVMGEPGAGRSNLVEGLARVLDADASRTRITTELDFHNSDTSQPVQITAILKGQRGVTADTALRLARYFGTAPQLWQNLQKAFELRVAEIESGPQIEERVQRRETTRMGGA